MAALTLPQCVLAEKEFAVMAGQVENLVKAVDKLNTAIVGNVGSDRPGIINELSLIKTHIGFNQPRTIHDRTTAIEAILVKQEERDRQNNDTVRKILLPIVDRVITFVLGGIAYVLVTNFVK